MIEYGIFNDEGLVEGQFYSEGEALEARVTRHSDDLWAEVHEVCPDHEEQPRDGCEECAIDGAEDDDLEHDAA